jgi:2-desacetyl-2-hydroxyethyl bacteriochlorophyllide A dehydrogenase
MNPGKERTAMPEEFVVTAPGTIEFRPYEEPPLEPRQVRVRSLMSGIKTGTELALFKGMTPFLSRRFDPEYRLFVPADGSALYPCNLGSWLVGEVVEAGSAVSGLRAGDLVHGGMPHRPTNVVDAAKLYRVPPGVDPETELFADPAIFALQAVHDAGIKIGDRVAVFGMGVIGLLAVQLARMSGAELVAAVDTVKDRLELASRFGASHAIDPNERDPAVAIKDLTGRKGVDVAIEISGSVLALEQAIRCVHREALVVAASYYKDSGPLALGAEWHHNRVTMLSSMAVWGCSHRSHPMWDLERIERTAIRLLESGGLETAGMITHRFSYEKAPEAYALLGSHPESTVKVLFLY